MTGQLSLFAAVRFGANFVHWMVFAHLPVLLKAGGFSDVQIGLLVALFSLSSMLLMLPVGVFSDFFSPKRTIILGAFLLGIYLVSLMTVRSFGPLTLIIVIGGLGNASMAVATESLYLKLFGREKRGQRVAAFQLSTYLGYGLGPLAGGLVMANGQEILFKFALAGIFLVFFLSFFLVDASPIVFSFRSYKGDLWQPKPLFLLACIFVLGSHFGVEQTSFSLFMRENLGFPPETVGLIFAGLGLWMALVVPFIGRLHDQRQQVFFFFLVGTLISSLFQIFTVWATGFWSLLFIRLLHTTGDAIALLELAVLTAAFFPTNRLGGNSGLLYAVRTMATFLAAILAGIINKHWGYGLSFILNGAGILVLAGVSMAFIRLSPELRQSVGWGHDQSADRNKNTEFRS